MPVTLVKDKVSGAEWFEHTCEECGAKASFGIGVKFRAALDALERGAKSECRRLLGKWYCGDHWRKNASAT